MKIMRHQKTTKKKKKIKSLLIGTHSSKDLVLSSETRRRSPHHSHSRQPKRTQPPHRLRICAMRKHLAFYGC